LISCHNLSGWSVAIWDEIAAHKIPIVQELNDFYLLCPNVNMFKGGKDCEKQCTLCKMMRSRHAHCSQSVSAAVGVSKFISDKFNDTSYFPNATKHVIHVARNIPAIQRKTNHSGGETMRFGYIGTLSEIKGVGWLISSFKSLDIDAKLIIAGTGNIAYEADMKDLAKSDPRIEFAGYVKPADFYPNISVLIVPSKWEEPLGMVAAEACAYDVPVIATKKGGLPELVKDGVNGILCDASDEESISKAIMKIYNDKKLYDTLRSNARESVSSMLSTEKTTNQYLEIYKALT
jgi:glycosyltransferase involved in cell wall biosynthesis